jgi:hypothetical protein
MDAYTYGRKTRVLNLSVSIVVHEDVELLLKGENLKNKEVEKEEYIVDTKTYPSRCICSIRLCSLWKYWN